MLKKLAIIYVIIAIVNYSIILYSGLNNEMLKNLTFWVSWPINIAGVMAVLGFALNRIFISSMFWKVILAGYIGIRIYELIKNGLFLQLAPLQQNIILGLNYAFLVVPPLVAIWYLAYIFNNKQKLITRHSS